MGAAVVLAGVAAGLYLWWDSGRLRISRLGPVVEFELLSQMPGVGGDVSYDGRKVSVKKSGAWARFSRDGGPWQGVDGLPECDRISITHIGTDGAIYGLYAVGKTTNSFVLHADGNVELHWPNDGVRDFLVNDSSDDGKSLAAFALGDARFGAVFIDGKLEWPVSDTSNNALGIAERISADGATVFSSVASGVYIVSQVWRNGKLDKSYDALASIRVTAVSRNGRWRACTYDDGVQLYDGRKSETIWTSEEKSPSLGKRWTEWVGGMTGKTAVRSSNAREMSHIAPLYVSDDGALVMGNHRFGDNGERHKPMVWQRGAGWEPLDAEMEKRGVVLPDGWRLDEVIGFSRDGQTISATAVKGEQSSPVVIRFRR